MRNKTFVLMDAIMRLGGSDVFATFVNRHTPRPGFFYYLHFFLEQCLICIIAHSGIISRVLVAQMSNATTKNMKKDEFLGILHDFI